jgi:D-apiose dehydrogenase
MAAEFHTMKELRFVSFGAGFWSAYQLAAWQEVPGVRCVAIYNRTKAKAEALAARFGIPQVYDDPETLLRNESADFADIVTDVSTHAPLVKLVAAHHLPVICQKPLAPTLADAESMVDICAQANVPLYVHENWRWQKPIRAFHAALRTAPIGRIWRAHINYWSSFPFAEFQPFLKDLDQFILTDIGTHILDTMRFLFGEAASVYARAHRITPGIKGEDAVSALFGLENGMTAYVNMSYASRVYGERFPETFITAEGEHGSVSLEADYTVHVVTRDAVRTSRHPPPAYAWADPRFGLPHASIVDANAHFASAMRGRTAAETTGEDNLRTLRLVFACYESIRTGSVIPVSLP